MRPDTRKTRRLRRSRGFTLIELMVVVVIIGILAALAIPRFNLAAHETKEKEADIILKQVYTLQTAYYAANHAWATDATLLQPFGFEAPAQLQNYTWAGDVEPPVCLISTGPWHNRQIDEDGHITNC